jgi:hypothetical protein
VTWTVVFRIFTQRQPHPLCSCSTCSDVSSKFCLCSEVCLKTEPTLVVIDTDCTWGRKSKYQTTMTTTASYTKNVDMDRCKAFTYNCMVRCTRYNIMWYQWLAISRWFSAGTPVFSTNKSDRRDITEILLKVTLNTITHPLTLLSVSKFQSCPLLF